MKFPHLATIKVFGLLFTVVLPFLGCEAKGALAYAVSAFEPLVRLDTDTGAVVVIGPLSPDPTRFQTPVGMAVRPTDGAIYVDNNSPTSDNGLARLDPATGLVIEFFSGTYNQLAFGSDGTLFTQVAPANIGASGPIARVNPANGAKETLSSGQHIPLLYGFAFNPIDEFLYGITGLSSPLSATLIKINPFTGVMVGNVALSAIEFPPLVGDMLFDAQGKLIVSTFGFSLYDVDVSTGVASNHRSVQDDFVPQGMGYIPVPEPTPILMTCLSSLYFCARRKRAT